MIFAPDEIEKLPGRQLIAAMREVLYDEDLRIRIGEEAAVKAGLRRRPDPELMSKAVRFHALDVALSRAIHDGQHATIKDFTSHLREAWRSAALREQIDADGTGAAHQPRDEAPDPTAPE